ncbi:hypothetical protein [Actinomadura sp. 7K507]|uniref:hypothetical protein n=1 Tax=Actinomadura sp. 7K507 TaxID=2530365 RepID=UPI0010490D6C|nr:hypothetical protein [Actinomadura sp. 7K507]TDC79529.1 hypothetical protein E1285_35970 [Actinomadura sp. 7K507]
MGVEDNTKTDRAETTDKPASQERSYTPPPDNPGSPGQPSRLESLARAREAQQASTAQRIEAGDADGEPSGERDTTPTAQGPGPMEPQCEQGGGRDEKAEDAENTDADTPDDAPGDWDKRVADEELLPDDNARLGRV